MPHYRAEYRAAVKAAIAAEPRFRCFRAKSAWAQNIDPRELPVFGVATPREPCSREGGTTVHRVTTVLIALKRAGGDDVEDILDEDSIEIERVVLPVLLARAQIVALAMTETFVNGEGSQRVGTLLMELTATRFTDEGSED